MEQVQREIDQCMRAISARYDFSLVTIGHDNQFSIFRQHQLPRLSIDYLSDSNELVYTQTKNQAA